MPSALLRAAITIAGSEEKLAKRAGYSQHAIWKAKKRGRVTGEMATAIERATGGAISRARLRPDLFGDLSPAPPTPIATLEQEHETA